MKHTGATFSVTPVETSTSLLEAVDCAFEWFKNKNCLMEAMSLLACPKFWPGVGDCPSPCLSQDALWHFLEDIPEALTVLAISTLPIWKTEGQILV